MKARAFAKLASAALLIGSTAFAIPTATAQGAPNTSDRDTFERGYRLGREDERLLSQRYQYDRGTRDRVDFGERADGRSTGNSGYRTRGDGAGFTHPGLWGERAPEWPPVERWIGPDGLMD